MSGRLDQRAVCPSCWAEHTGWECMKLLSNQWFCPTNDVRLARTSGTPAKWELFTGKEGQK